VLVLWKIDSVLVDYFGKFTDFMRNNEGIKVPDIVSDCHYQHDWRNVDPVRIYRAKQRFNDHFAEHLAIDKDMASIIKAVSQLHETSQMVASTPEGVTTNMAMRLFGNQPIDGIISGYEMVRLSFDMVFDTSEYILDCVRQNVYGPAVPMCVDALWNQGWDGARVRSPQDCYNAIADLKEMIDKEMRLP